MKSIKYALIIGLVLLLTGCGKESLQTGDIIGNEFTNYLTMQKTSTTKMYDELKEMNETLRNQMRNQEMATDLLGVVELCKNDVSKQLKEKYSKSKVEIKNNKCTINFDYKEITLKAVVEINEKENSIKTTINQRKNTVMKFEMVSNEDGYASKYFYKLDEGAKTYKTLLTPNSILIGVFEEEAEVFKPIYNFENELTEQEVKKSGLWFHLDKESLGYSQPANN